MMPTSASLSIQGIEMNVDGTIDRALYLIEAARIALIECLGNDSALPAMIPTPGMIAICDEVYMFHVTELIRRIKAFPAGMDLRPATEAEVMMALWDDWENTNRDPVLLAIYGRIFLRIFGKTTGIVSDETKIKVMQYAISASDVREQFAALSKKYRNRSRYVLHGPYEPGWKKAS